MSFYEFSFEKDKAIELLKLCDDLNTFGSVDLFPFATDLVLGIVIDELFHGLLSKVHSMLSSLFC